MNPTARRGAQGFALLGAVQTSLIFTLTAIAVPLPQIGREFGLGRADLVLLNAAYGLSFAGLLLFGGRLADRSGGRRVLSTGLLLFGAASLASALAPDHPALLAARFAQGAGAALLAPAAMAVLRTLFAEPAAHARALATWSGLSVLGATAGNLLSGVISAAASWRWTFAVPLAVTAAALTLGPRLLPADPARDDRRHGPRAVDRPALDLPGAVLATAGITLAGYGLVLTEDRPWSSPAVVGALVGAATLLGAFLLVELRVRDPLLPPGFLLHRRRAPALTAIGLTAAGTSTTFVLLSLHLQQQRGWSPLATSGAFLPFAVALLGSGRATGPLIGRFGPRRVTVVGLAVAATGLLLLAATGFDPGLPYPVALLPGLVLLPAGAAGSFAGAVVLAAQGVPRDRSGLAGGVLNTAMELGPTLVLAVLLTTGSDSASLALAAAALAATALTAAAMTRPGPRAGTGHRTPARPRAPAGP
ncbi:MFS transporter [Kitasatospora sp. NBC_00240]|uniref:MFS transporter n=1 Tax=Kitasatospora sp. NBC_00240 TaxID=2903567 RepID=UPI0022501F55|nr:MFS transporter [Kitasatospora sp. NBC_00240]MCX5214195.1 MFS transporter [Kitasatospora sp. NBC_00240]